MLKVLNTTESSESWRITEVKGKLLFIKVSDDPIYTCQLLNNVEIQ